MWVQTMIEFEYTVISGSHLKPKQIWSLNLEAEGYDVLYGQIQ